MGDALLPEHYAFIWDMWRQWSLNLRPLLNWTTPSPSVSIYPGIRSIGGRIIEINLQDGDIGAIPPSIGSLVTLRVLFDIFPYFTPALRQFAADTLCCDPRLVC